VKLLTTVVTVLVLSFSVALASATPLTQYSEVPAGMTVVPNTVQMPPTPAGQFRSLTYYNNRAVLDAAFPGLTQEDFSGTNLPPNAVGACLGPFNSATNNACFSPGAIVDGISLDNAQLGDNVVLTIGFLGVTSVSVGPNTFDDDAVITFSGPTNAFGADIVNPFGTIMLDIEVFGPNGSLGTTTATSGITPAFWGVSSSSDPITRIEFVESAGSPEAGELFQNVEFGAGGATPIEAATWGLIKDTFNN